MLPKSVLALRTYSIEQFRHDAIAGITVGLVALPLAMAFAISSGVLPQAGIYCAIVTGFVISALGGSKFQIGGPTGAFVVVVAGIVAKYGLDGLLMATMMAGAILVVLGATGLGSAVKFIPLPVVLGFTNGIAVVIASTRSATSSASSWRAFPASSSRACARWRQPPAHGRRSPPGSESARCCFCWCGDALSLGSPVTSWC
jgi:MFS superfamily sulfate permease-like transporter